MATSSLFCQRLVCVSWPRPGGANTYKRKLWHCSTSLAWRGQPPCAGSGDQRSDKSSWSLYRCLFAFRPGGRAPVEPRQPNKSFYCRLVYAIGSRPGGTNNFATQCPYRPGSRSLSEAIASRAFVDISPSGQCLLCS